MKRDIAIMLFIFMLALPATAVHAKTMYVSDDLVITLRAGKGEEFRIIDHLSTDTPVEVLSEEGDFLFVRTPKGKEGWVRKRYITSETPKAQVIAELKREIDNIKAMSGEAKDLSAENAKIRAENEKLVLKNRQLEDDLEGVEQKEMIYWFLAGGGVLFLGWLIGRASRQKRYY